MQQNKLQENDQYKKMYQSMLQSGWKGVSTVINGSGLKFVLFYNRQEERFRMMEIPKNYTLYEKSSTTTNTPLILVENKGKTEDNDEFGFKVTDEFGFKVTKNEEGDNVTKYYKYQNNGQSKQ